MASAPSSVGLVGLGLVGSALAKRMTGAGFAVVGWDHAQAARGRYATAGGVVAASLQALGERPTVLVLAVFETADVLHVLEGGGNVLDGAVAGTTNTVSAIRCVIDCSTGDPARLPALSERLAARGIDFLEAPLSGSSAQIEAGTATMLLGGAAGCIAAHSAVLAALSPQRLHVGGAGQGAATKLATNLVLGLNRAALAEGMAFAEKLGIAPAQFLAAVLASPARSEAALAKGALMAAADVATRAPQSRIRQHLKDLELMLDHAPNWPLTTAHATLLRAAVAAGEGEQDNAAIVNQLRRTLAGDLTPRAEPVLPALPPR